MITFEYLAFVQVNAAGTITDEWTFADATPGGSEYALVEYAPGVAPLRRSRLGGSGAYEEVAESLTCHCLGGTAAQAVAAYERLIGALDTAGQWNNEEFDAPIIHLRMRIVDGTVGELAAVVLGPVPSESPATVSADWDQSVGMWAVRNVTLSFRRRGLLLIPTPDSVAPTATGLNVASATFTTPAQALSPLELTIRADSASSTLGSNIRGFLLAGPAGYVMLQNLGTTGTASPVGGGAGTWATVVDATARGGNVKRYTGTGTVVPTSFLFDTTIVPPATSKVLHLFVTAKNNHNLINFLLQGGIVIEGAVAGDTLISAGPGVIVPADPVNPGSYAYTYYLGSVSKAVDWASFRVFVTATTQSAAGAGVTLDVNVMGVLAEHPASRAIAFERLIGMRQTDDRRVIASARPLDGITPLFAPLYSPGGITAGLPPCTFAGDTYLEAQNTYDMCMFAMESKSSFPWQLSTSVPAALPLQFTLRRWRGYRVPQ